MGAALIFREENILMSRKKMMQTNGDNQQHEQ
jgi:hypothetical protein